MLITNKNIYEFNHFVYRHIRLDKGVPFYIGIGSKRGKGVTHTSEFYRAYNTSSRSFLWKRVANITDIEVDILFESNDYEEALKKEVEFITMYKSVNNGGTLVNLTDGGEVFSDNCRIASSKRGLETFGEKHPSSILSEAEVIEIINYYNSGCGFMEICRKYTKLTKYNIYRILYGKSWKHLSYLIDPSVKSNYKHKRRQRKFDIPNILDAYINGVSLDKISKQFLIDRHLAKEILFDNGVKMWTKRERVDLFGQLPSNAKK